MTDARVLIKLERAVVVTVERIDRRAVGLRLHYDVLGERRHTDVNARQGETIEVNIDLLLGNGLYEFAADVVARERERLSLPRRASGFRS